MLSLCEQVLHAIHRIIFHQKYKYNRSHVKPGPFYKNVRHYNSIRTFAYANMRALYKLLVLTYWALEETDPSYLWDIVELYKLKTSLVLHSDGQLDLPWSNLVSYGDRAFSVAAPSEWNNLPSDLKDCTSYNLFKSKLKL